MTSQVSLVTPQTTRRPSGRSHRIDVHRHADEYLANLDKIAQSEKLNKFEYKPGMLMNFVSNFAKGLEMMFKIFHIKP